METEFGVIVAVVLTILDEFVISDILFDVVFVLFEVVFVLFDVLLELSAKESEKAYCGKISIAESKMGIMNCIFKLSHHHDSVNKQLCHFVH